MAEQEKLPKPLTDLPLPEKEIPANVGVKPVWKSKILWGFVIASTLIAFLLGGFVLGRTSSKKLPAQTVIQTPTPTPDPTADWQTYTDEAAGISFKHPEDWKIVEKLQPDGTKIVSVDSPNKSFQFYYDVYDVSKQITKFLCKGCKYTSLSTIQLDADTTGYVVINSDLLNNSTLNEQQISVSKVKNASENDQGWPHIASPNNPNLFIRWSGEYIDEKCVDQLCPVSMDINEFKAKPEVKTALEILKTFKFTNPTSQSFLGVPEYGVKFALTDPIKDAYYDISKDQQGLTHTNLRVHSLDSESDCKNSEGSIANLSRLGKNDPVSFGLTYAEFTTNRASGTTVGSYFYYIELAQYPCAQKPENQTLLSNVRKAFTEASKTIQKL